ncbi:unnamed protein product [Adineta steineri]|uniref:LIM zinc-binding domain-containing protein n=1 Tax=Adineta steineri TaxID=433720 RepID=A0A819GB86_9BILA|nr:unnamed protein product [Adineta steineri]
MNRSQQIEDNSMHRRQSREDIVTSVWVPSPSSLIQNQSTYSNDNPTNKIYKTELLINRIPITPTANPLNNCSKCQRLIDCGNDKEIKFNNRYYHSNCFKCSTCNELINSSEDKKYLIDDNGEVICKKCELSKSKRCFNCHQSILDEKFICFNENNYHRPCFSCYSCRKSLINQVNIRIKDNQACCDECYGEKFSRKCEKCSQIISSGGSIVYKGKNYHEQCFRCGQCSRIMNEKEFYTENDKPCCSQCYDKYFALQCQQCSQIIKEKEYYTHNSKPCCIRCYEQSFAPQCQQCSRVISSGKSIQYNGNNYHEQCFRCGQCNNIMNEKQFYTQNNKPCCSLCHEKYFQKKCSKCFQSINDKYTVYKDKFYHINCFKCDKCYRIIDDNEKFTDNQFGIICSTCRI